MRARLLARVAVVAGAVVVLARLLRPARRSAGSGPSPPPPPPPPLPLPQPSQPGPVSSPAATADPPAPPGRHQPETVSVRAVLLFSLGLVVSLASLLLALWGLRATSTDDGHAPSLPPWSDPGPAPLLGSGQDAPWRHWVDPWRDADLVLERQRRHLGSYGWIDSSVRIVHVPIEQAIDAIARGQDAQSLMRSAGAAR